MAECGSSGTPEPEALNNCSSVVGERFSTYKQLKEKVELFEKANSIQFGYRDSRTLEGAKKRIPKRVERANSELKYYSIHLTCMFGGRKFKSRSTGLRKHKL